ncbi:MAG: YqeG family HAD IIIA-type phosphatase [Candidatus Competibacteraceae bacterium]|nr:YqeG family HAD IIIA-type phosphatase [Candidatus Competibacteraceae bacterium]
MFLKPTYLIAGDITDIDIEELSRIGIKGLILDLDSTLVAPKSAQITEEAREWLDRARQRFQIAIASNNKNEAYLDLVRKDLAITIVGRAKKPSRQAFHRLLQDFGLTAGEVAVIGDRPLTDIWGGQRAGMKTILVDTLKTMVEPDWKRSIRKLERIFIRAD